MDLTAQVGHLFNNVQPDPIPLLLVSLLSLSVVAVLVAATVPAALLYQRALLEPGLLKLEPLHYLPVLFVRAETFVLVV